MQHTYTLQGSYNVTLNAVKNSDGINAVSSTPVFITGCTPTNCPLNKFDFEYGYLDFSSGTPVSVGHNAAYGDASFSDIYNLFYRGDSNGNPLFHISYRGYSGNFITALLDTSFTAVDTFNSGYANQILLPLPMHPDMYCLTGNYFLTSNPVNGSFTTQLTCSVLKPYNGQVNAVPGKRLVAFPPQAGVLNNRIYQVTAVPNCDGSAFWIIAATPQSYLVFKLDSSGTVTYNSQYPGTNDFILQSLIASPDGRTIGVGWANNPASQPQGLSYLDFDKSAGVITAYHELFRNIVPYAPDWSASRPVFSPNSRYMYYVDQCCQSQSGNTGSFCQSDMYSPDPYGTRKIIYQFPTDNLAYGPWTDCKQGPDGKLYIGYEPIQGNAPQAYRLAVINNPNVAENGYNSVGFNPNGPDVTPPNCPYMWGFNLIGFHGFSDRTEAFGCDWVPDVPKPFSYQAQGCLTYTFYSDDCWNASWNFADAASGAENTSTLSQPVHQFSGPGNYAVNLLINGYQFTDTIRITAPDAHIASSAVSACPAPNGSYSVAVVQPYVNYAWSVTNGTPASANGLAWISVQWNQPGNGGPVMLIATDTVTGCADTATQNVSFNISDSVTINHLTDSICPGATYMLNSHAYTAAGVYNDSAIGTNGCKTVTVLTLANKVSPNVAWAGSTDTINVLNGSITLTGGTPPGGTYTGPGVSGSTFNPASLTMPGTYTLSYTYVAHNGCSATANRPFVVIMAGINQLSSDAGVFIYPNPTSGRLIIQVQNIKPETIIVYDMDGRVIYNMPYKNEIDVSALSGGVYFIEVTSPEGTGRKRFVKM